MKIIYFLISIIFLVNSKAECVENNELTLNNFKNIFIGQSYSEFIIINKQKPQYEFTFTMDSINYKIINFEIVNQILIYHPPGPSTQTDSRNVYDNFYIIFESNKILYFGYLNEFFKSNQQKLINIANKIFDEKMKILMELYKSNN